MVISIQILSNRLKIYRNDNISIYFHFSFGFLFLFLFPFKINTNIISIKWCTGDT